MLSLIVSSLCDLNMHVPPDTCNLYVWHTCMSRSPGECASVRGGEDTKRLVGLARVWAELASKHVILVLSAGVFWNGLCGAASF